MSEHKTECPIVQDLLPLYIDHLTSDESAQMIEAHIAACEECQKALDTMKENYPQLSDAPEDAVEKAVHRTQKRERLIGALWMMLACLVIFLVLFILSSQNQFKIPFSDVDVKSLYLIEQPEENVQTLVALVRVDERYDSLLFEAGRDSISGGAEQMNMNIYTSILPLPWERKAYSDETQCIIVQQFPLTGTVAFSINGTNIDCSQTSQTAPTYIYEMIDRTHGNAAGTAARYGVELGENSLVLNDGDTYEMWSYDGTLLQNGSPAS